MKGRSRKEDRREIRRKREGRGDEKDGREIERRDRERKGRTGEWQR